MEDLSLISLGYCYRPHGIKGGLSCHLYNDEDSSLAVIEQLYLFPKNKDSCLNPVGEIFKIKNINLNKKVIIYLEGVNERNRAEELIPFEIKANREDLPALDEKKGEYYLADLVGLKVIDFSSENHIGIVSNFYDNGAQAVLIIEGDGVLELPFVDVFFKEVDIKKGVIKIIRPEVISERD